MNELCSVKYLAETLGTTQDAVAKALRDLGAKPAMMLDGVCYYDEAGYCRVQSELFRSGVIALPDIEFVCDVIFEN